MEKTKKLLALLIAATMSVAALTACGDKKEADKPGEAPVATDAAKPASDEDQIKAVLETYAGCAATLDIAGALDCVKEGTDLYEDMESVGDMNLTDIFVMGMQQSANIDDDLAQELADKLTPAMESLLNNLKDSIEIEYDSIEIDGDTAAVEATLIIPDTEAVFADDFAAAVMDELGSVNPAGMSDDELIDVIVEAVENALDSIDFSDVDTQESNGSLELEKVDGEWLITADK